VVGAQEVEKELVITVSLVNFSQIGQDILPNDKQSFTAEGLVPHLQPQCDTMAISFTHQPTPEAEAALETSSQGFYRPTF
jgi:hypothetical protein